MSILGPKELAALTIAYKLYRFKGKLQRKVIETIFYAATGRKLGPEYYAIPIVRLLMELT
jgi:hypothetical protein